MRELNKAEPKRNHFEMTEISRASIQAALKRQKFERDYKPQDLGQKLGYLVEEAGEVMAAVGKSQRWGLLSVNPELPEEEQETNGCWIMRELDDLERAIDMVREELDAMGFTADA